MDHRFDSYLQHAGEALRDGDLVRSEGLERQARATLEGLGSPPRLAWKLHGHRGERALAQADYPAAEAAFTEAVTALRVAGGGGRVLFDLLRRLGAACAHQGEDERALHALDDAVAVAAAIGPAFHPVAHAHIARAQSLRRLARRADAEQSLRLALAVAEHAPHDNRERIVSAARQALEELRPGASAAQPSPPPAPPRATGAAASIPPARAVDEQAFDAVLAELDDLIGLVGVKAQIHRLAGLLRMAAIRRDAGLKTVQVSLHLVFIGGAGTGKTTVARLFGRLYRSLGLLASDRVVEVTRDDLVAGYIGQTAAKTEEVVDSALDGVLFIDEAYGLVRPGSESDFGGEAVTALLKRMEDDRDRLAVIVAGYEPEMREFLASNSGFASRFGETVRFEDYGPAELLAIFEKFAADSDYAPDAGARTELVHVLDRLHAVRDRYFGNARTMRNLFEDVCTHQAQRLLAAGVTAGDGERLRTLTAADVRASAEAAPG
jgi:SpoVK/Ycf46/Vps4 family AAA+-type ATPase